MNGDGSVDLYSEPNALTGLEGNWIPTMGKEPYLWLRLYGPAEAFWTNGHSDAPRIRDVVST